MFTPVFRRLSVLPLVALGIAMFGSPAAAVTAAPIAIAAETLATRTDTTRQIRFEIPAGSLADALVTFSRQSGIHVEFDPAELTGVQANAVAGSLTAQAALRILLSGAQVRARFRNAQTVVIARATREDVSQSLAPVVVTADAARRAGYVAPRTVTATRTDALIRDVPQSITIVGRALIADQSMQSMADVVRYIPGVTMGQGEGHRDAPTIRGNSTTADFYADGVRDDAQYLRDLYNVERIEALKGANAMVFGRGGGGGVINRVMKEAEWAPTRSLTVEGGSDEHRRTTLDVGDGLGGRFAARFNAMVEDSRYFRDATELERYGVNPSVALIAGSTLVRAGYEYFADRRTVNRGIPSLDGSPAPAPIETFFGDPNASHSRAYVHSAGVTIERGFAGTVMLRNRTRFVQYDKYYQNVFPGATDAAGTSVALSAYNSSTDRRNLFNQTDLTRTFGSGWLRQTVLVGAELGRQTTDNFRNTGFFDGTATALSVPFDQPTVSPAVEYRQSASDADNNVEATTAAVYIQDQVELGSNWQVIAGLRYDRFALDFHNHRNDSRLERDDEMLSPRLGLVFKPTEPISIYTSYTVSHLPSSGDQFASLTATTQALEPERFINREIGLKWDLRPDLSIAAALYRLDRTNTAAPDPNDVTRIVQTGRQRSTGHEITVTGNVTAAWQVAAGYASQRATIRSRTSAAAPGATAPLVPRQTLSVWNRYRFTPRVGAGIGVVHQTKMYAAVDNTVTLPGFTRVDAAAYLTLTGTLRAQVNLENLFDERYFPTSHGNNNIMPGAPRSVRFSLTVTP